VRFVQESPVDAKLEDWLGKHRILFVDQGRAEHLLPATRAMEYVKRVMSIGGNVDVNNGAAVHLRSYLLGNYTDINRLVELTDNGY
jgi:hypothetical protein